MVDARSGGTGRASIAVPHWRIAIPITSRASRLADGGRVQQRASGATQADGDPWKAGLALSTTSSTTRRRRRSSSTSRSTTSRSSARWRAIAQPVHAARRRRGADAADLAAVPAARREPRRAVRRAGRRRAGPKASSSASPSCGAHLLKRRRRERPAVRIGIVCYASHGRQRHRRHRAGRGAGARGHDVHVLSTEPPFRLPAGTTGPDVPRVATPAYPLFREPQYLLSLADHDRPGLASNASRHRPRALRRAARRGRLSGAPDHGGAPDRSRAEGHDDAARHRHHAGRQRPVVLRDRRLLHRSVRWRHGGVGEPAQSTPAARSGSRATSRSFPNFLDGDRFARRPALRARSAARPGAHRPHLELPAGEAHRRASWRSSSAIRAKVPARLVLVGDGPELAAPRAGVARPASRPT